MAGPKQVVYTPVDMSDAEYTEFEPDAKMEADKITANAQKAAE